LRYLQGRYVDDITVPGQLHGAVLRSPHGHAWIESIDATAARALPGVHGVFTAADLDADGVGSLPCIAQVATVAPTIVPPRWALARDRVRHVGDPVAFVVAVTAQQARDATERVDVAYRPLPAVVDAGEALGAQAPLLWDEAPGNLSYRFERGDKAAVDAAFAAAAHIVAIELVNNRLVVAPIEPRAAIGTCDAAANSFDLLLTGQGVHSLRRQLAEAVFNMPPDRITVRAPDVGGGFGVKNFLYPEWVLVLWAARRLGRPVRWVAERGEEFVSSAQGRDNHTRARLALDRDGRFLALDVDTVANLGAYLSTNGPGSSTNSPASAMGGVYDIPAVFMAVRGVLTNTVPIDAYRGAGKPEANYLIERLVDRAARRLAFDPVALRRRNLISHFPYRSGLGVTIDCGRFVANLDEMAQRVSVDGFVVRRAASAQHGRLRGLGIACFLETSRGTPGERAEIRFEADGRVALVIGTQSNGQGHETSFPQIAADLLGLPLAAFRFVQADTSAVKSGNGHGGARSMHMGGNALYLAAQMVLSKSRTLAAHLLQADASEVSFSAGHFTVADSERGIDLLALAEAARDPANLPDDMTPGLDADAYNDSDVFTFPNGCHTAEVEIDPETGGDARALSSDRRLRPADQPDADARPGPWRARPGHWASAARTHRLRRAIGPAAERVVYRLRPAACRRFTAALHYPRRTADRGQPARCQGCRPSRLHGRTTNHHQCDPRRASPARHRAYRHARHSRAGLARDPQRARQPINHGQPKTLRLSGGSQPKTLRPPFACEARRS
jgi:carbon-monoxide dehydrogenase large subunit